MPDDVSEVEALFDALYYGLYPPATTGKSPARHRHEAVEAIAALRSALDSMREELRAAEESYAGCKRARESIAAEATAWTERAEAAEVQLAALRADYRWNAGLLTDAIRSLRSDDHISREDIAGSLERDMRGSDA